MSGNLRIGSITPRTEKGKIDRERAISMRTTRAPVSPRIGESKARYSEYLKESIARSENLAREESEKKQECSGQGCIGKLKSGLSRISKAVGMSGGRKTRRTRRTRRTTRRSGRKSRHSRR